MTTDKPDLQDVATDKSKHLPYDTSLRVKNRLITQNEELVMSNQKINDGEELWAVADLCLIPMGVADPSVGPQIAEVSVETGVVFTSKMAD